MAISNNTLTSSTLSVSIRFDLVLKLLSIALTNRSVVENDKKTCRYITDQIKKYLEILLNNNAFNGRDNKREITLYVLLSLFDHVQLDDIKKVIGSASLEKTNYCNKYINKALQHYYSYDVIEYLLQKGAAVDSLDDIALTALDRHNDREKLLQLLPNARKQIEKFLIRTYANFNLKEIDNPLILAIAKGDLNSFKKILSKDKSLLDKGDSCYYLKPVSYAVAFSQQEILKYIFTLRKSQKDFLLADYLFCVNPEISCLLLKQFNANNSMFKKDESELYRPDMLGITPACLGLLIHQESFISRIDKNKPLHAIPEGNLSDLQLMLIAQIQNMLGIIIQRNDPLLAEDYFIQAIMTVGQVQELDIRYILTLFANNLLRIKQRVISVKPELPQQNNMVVRKETLDCNDQP